MKKFVLHIDCALIILKNSKLKQSPKTSSTDRLWTDLKGEKIHKKCTINCFLLVVDTAVPSNDQHLKDMIKL